MGCGSLSTVAVQSSFGTNWPTRDHNPLRDKDNPNCKAPDDKRISESSKLSLRISSTSKSESNSRKSRTNMFNGDVHGKGGDRPSNFNVFVKELDDEKYKIDDGGVWLGTENAVNEETPSLERSLVPDVYSGEEASSSDLFKHRFSESPNKGVNSVCAEYATIILDSSDSTYTPQHEKIKNEKSALHEPSTAIFSQGSSIQRRHLQRIHHVHFESMEDKYSYSYGHYIDDDKQMSDSELADWEVSLIPSRNPLTTVRFTGCNASGEVPCEADRDATNVVDGSSKLPAEPTRSPLSDTLSRDTSKVRKSKEVDTDFKKKDKISETSPVGKTLEDFPTCSDNPFIPQFVFKCVSYLEEVGLKTEGLYRICGNKAQAELFENKYFADPELDMAALGIPVNVIATVLKNFFKDLREALIPSNVYEDLMKAVEAEGKDSQLAMLGNIIKKLPPQNFEVFKYIISHLSRIADNQEFNSMNSRNLAKCWWPTLIRMEFESYEKLVQKLQVPEDIIQIFIEQCAFIFYVKSDV